MMNAGISDSVDKVSNFVTGPNGQAKSCRLSTGAQNPGSSSVPGLLPRNVSRRRLVHRGGVGKGGA